jgi:deoxycytidylate deaminase
MKIYVASSWRNCYQPVVVEQLRAVGHDVYDFRDPEGKGKDSGFHWSQIDSQWQDWTAREFIAALDHPLAVKHFHMDFKAMVHADALVMVMPCGRSAHLEAGWATAKRPTAILLSGPAEPELMYKQADLIAPSIEEVISWLDSEWVQGMAMRPRDFVPKAARAILSPGERPKWDKYFMDIAHDVATRATCDRKHVGAVIVDQRHRIVSTGYNGAPAGMPHCDEVGHELKEIDGRLSCVRTLHAESNALDDAGRRAVGCTLCVTVTPCYPCAQRLVNAGIVRIVYGEWYDSQNTDLVAAYLKSAGVGLVKA